MTEKSDRGSRYTAAIALPLLTFWIIWICQLGMYFFNPYNYRPIAGYTWFVVGISLLCVTLGYLTYILAVHIHNYREGSSPVAPVLDQTRIHSFKNYIYAICTVSFLAVLALLYYLTKEIGGLGELVTNRIGLRDLFVVIIKFSASDWNVLVSLLLYIYNFNHVAILLSALYFTHASRPGFAAFWPLLNATLYSLITLQRFAFVQTLVIWMFVALIAAYFLPAQRRKAALKRYFKLLFLAFPATLVLLLGVIILRIDFGEKEIDYLLTLRYAVGTVYTYVAGNIVALDQFLQKFNDFAWGGSVFRSFFKWFVRIGVVDPELFRAPIHEFTDVGPMALNTYTFIRPFFEDVGIISTLIYSYIWGGVSAFAFVSLFRRFTLVRLHFCGLLFFSFFLSFYGFSLINLTQIAYLTAVVVVFEQVLVSGNRSPNKLSVHRGLNPSS